MSRLRPIDLLADVAGVCRCPRCGRRIWNAWISAELDGHHLHWHCQDRMFAWPRVLPSSWGRAVLRWRKR